MKVLQINAVYGISSTGRTSMELDSALQREGHESIIATTRTNRKQNNIYIIGNSVDWKIHSFLSRLIGKQGYFSHISTKVFLSFIDKEKPDVIHLRNLHANYINIPMLLKYIAKNKIPTVITLHDCWFFTGKCCYYTDDKCEKWKTQCDNCPALKKWNRSWFFDRSKEMFSEKDALLNSIPRLAVIGVSDWITNEAKQSILKNAWLVKRIYNWIDLEIFKPQDTTELRQTLHLESEFVVLGVAQTWSKEKGIEIFQKISCELNNIKVVLIGNMPKEYILPTNVISVGVVADTKLLASYYAMADVMVNPSIQETFGKTTAEAIASGTPVVGYNLTATPELIGQGCGVLVNKSDGIQAFVNAINVVKSSGKEYYSEACAKFVANPFNKDYLINEYIRLYKEMIK